MGHKKLKYLILQSLQRIKKSGELEQSYTEKEQITQNDKPKV